jgi:prepilin-type N-terminal cleavage/methylation domain-containing protein
MTVRPRAPSALHRGFTIVEIMLVLSLLGVLAAVAIPAFVSHARRARTSEAVDRLAYLYQSSALYFTGEHRSSPYGSGVAPHAFPPPSVPTPAAVPAAARVTDPPGTWQTPTWQALGFAITDAHYYSYAYDSLGTNAQAAFTARALGDLDGNGVFSTFERAGAVTPQFEIRGADGLWINHEVE